MLLALGATTLGAAASNAATCIETNRRLPHRLPRLGVRRGCKCLRKVSQRWTGTYIAETARPLTAHKNSRKAQIHVGRCQTGTGKRQCFEAIGPDRLFRTARGRAGSASVFSANRTGKGAPAYTGQAAHRCAIDSSAPDQVSKKEFCSSDPSIAWLLLQK